MNSSASPTPASPSTAGDPRLERVLFVHAHPDDETITTGGTIAAMVEADTVDQKALDAVGEMPADLVQFTPEQTEQATSLLAEKWAAAIS